MTSNLLPMTVLRSCEGTLFDLLNVHANEWTGGNCTEQWSCVRVNYRQTVRLPTVARLVYARTFWLLILVAVNCCTEVLQPTLQCL